MSGPYILAIDQGTTSSRTIIYDSNAERISVGQQEFQQYYPERGWVEHDAEEIWETTLRTAQDAISKGEIDPSDIAGIGITNQRETVVVWDRETGKPVHNAIVWQDRRTADHCERLKAEGAEERVIAKTGLLLDPYFSASKIGWILDNVKGARSRAEAGELAFGTIDSFLLWRLTGGRVHATDASNASRTLLFDIEKGDWSTEMCALFGVPMALLPEIGGNSEVYGKTDSELLGAAIPVSGMAGDQQAALFGQGCFRPGMVKSTYGTGCFVVMNTGTEIVRSGHRLLTTVAYRLGDKTIYALEGSIFVAGAAVKWLRDQLELVESASETNEIASNLSDNGGVYLVPAFAGLGAPHWEPHARAAILGLTLGSSKAHVVRATIESVAYQTMDLIDAMVADGAEHPKTLRIDGGMAANDWLAGFLADMIGTQVDRPADLETTARGAAYLAGLGVGVWKDLEELEAMSAIQSSTSPTMSADDREVLIAGWREALGRVLKEGKS